MLSAMS